MERRKVKRREKPPLTKGGKARHQPGRGDLREQESGDENTMLRYVNQSGRVE